MDFKKLLNKFNKENFIKYQRYCYAAVAGIALVLLLIFATNNGERKTSAEVNEFSTDQSFEIDKYSEINELIESYYAAYATSSIESLSTVAYPISTNEASYIGVFNQFTEDITNIKVYSMVGPETDSFFVSVSYDIKFTGIETLSPSLDFFYIQKDEDGNYYINNKYSTYNYSHQDEALEAEICNDIQKYASMDCVKELKSQIQAKYNEAIASDEALSNLIQVTLRNEIHLWAETIAAASKDTENTETTETTETTEKKEETQKSEDTQKTEEKKEETQKEVKVKVTAKKVNVRESASEDAEILGKAYKDNKYKKLGTEGNWTKIDFDGKTGYIASQYVEEVKE